MRHASRQRSTHTLSPVPSLVCLPACLSTRLSASAQPFPCPLPHTHTPAQPSTPHRRSALHNAQEQGKSTSLLQPITPPRCPATAHNAALWGDGTLTDARRVVRTDVGARTKTTTRSASSPSRRRARSTPRSSRLVPRPPSARTLPDR